MVKRQKSLILLILLITFALEGHTQDTLCMSPVTEYRIDSREMSEMRNHWVALPLHYSDTTSYPVIYVLDAEWRFDLVRHMAFDMGGHDKISKSIIVGIPHIRGDTKRGMDLTFSESRVEYDGEVVDSTFYNASNSGGALKFFNYLTRELMPDIQKKYTTNGHETLVGHSYGGYFAGYLLSLSHPFEVLHLYDPSIWYSDGEVTERVQNHFNGQTVRIHLTYQPQPPFHKDHIEELMEVLDENDKITLSRHLYEEESHNSLYMDSFYRGIVLTQK